MAMVAWIVVLAILARYFVPRMRRAATAAAEQGSSLTGKIVDAFSNIQMLKLFGTAEGDDRFVRAGFDDYLAAMRRLARTLVGVRSAMAAAILRKAGFARVANVAGGMVRWRELGLPS